VNTSYKGNFPVTTSENTWGTIMNNDSLHSSCQPALNFFLIVNMWSKGFLSISQEVQVYYVLKTEINLQRWMHR